MEKIMSYMTLNTGSETIYYLQDCKSLNILLKLYERTIAGYTISSRIRDTK